MKMDVYPFRMKLTERLIMDDRIHKAKKEIDELNRQCNEVWLDYITSSKSQDNQDFSGQEDNPMDPEEKKYLCLGEMILRLQDNDLEERYFLRMQKWLLIDPKALNYYCEHIFLCANLYCLFQKKEVTISPIHIRAGRISDQL